MRILKPLFFFWLVLTLAGAFAAAPAAFAQECPRGPGVPELPSPAVTAAEADADPTKLGEFALAALSATTAPTRSIDEAYYIACLFRHRGGPFFSGSTYTITLTLDGRVWINANDMSTGGEPINPRIYGAILHALGIDVTSPAAIQAGLGNVAATGTFPKPEGGAFNAGPLGVPGASGYAVGYIAPRTRTPFILLAGFDLQASHLAPDDVDPGMPAITAAQVTDRATLKQFVDEAVDFAKTLFESGDPAAFSKIRIAFRDPNGPWRHGPTYLFVMQRTGYTIFHGAFPDRFEFQTPTNTLREQLPSGEQGDLILPKIIRTARNNPAGDFVEYYFDNPDDPADDFNTLKVSYVREYEVEVPLPGGGVYRDAIIVGAGIYGEGTGGMAQECPRGPGIPELAPPAVTAAEAEADPTKLGEFAHAALRATTATTRNIDEASYIACLFRARGGPFFSGSTYTITLTLDGRVWINTNDMSTAGQPLNPAIYGAILHGLGIDVISPATIQAGLGSVAATGTFPNPQGGAFDAGPFGAPGASGYAVGYISPISRAPSILLVGFDLKPSHLAPETIDHGMPAITAAQVTDRATLKQFVDEAADFAKTIAESGDLSAASKIRVAFRDPNGPWRSGPTYLFIMQSNGYTLFHGAFPDRFELQRPTDTLRDQRTGELILPQIIQTAERVGEAGGYVEYYFDNPDDPTDDFNTLKVSYVREYEVEVPLPNGTVYRDRLIIGAGIYGEGTGGMADVCPLPAGVTANPLATPSVTAAEVEADSSRLTDFALAARDYMRSVRIGAEITHNACIIRQEGPWKSGGTYLATVSLEGRVFFHSAKAALSGRPLNNAVYGAILRALGITATAPADVRAALAKVVADRAFPNANGGALPARIGGGYAVGFTRTGGSPLILVAGLDIGERHLGTETVDPGDPEVRADEVVDRATLKAFVEGATQYVIDRSRADGRRAFTQIKSVLRDPNGPWRHGPTYLFIMEPTGYTIFHGAFPDRFEFQTPTNTLREQLPSGEQGDLILPKIIRTARSNPDGDFVEYYFDNPDDPNDDFNTLKVSFVRQHVFQGRNADGTTFEYPLIFGAGIYGEQDAVSAASVAAARGWLARFGRAAGSQAVEMISSRLNAPAQGGAKMTLGGRTVKLDADPDRYLAKEDVGLTASLSHDGIDARSLSRARTANRLTNGEQDSPGAYREMTMSQFLSGASFHLASTKEAAEAAGSRWSIWGRGAQSSFEGGGEAAIEGDVTTAMLGVDYEKGKLLAGVALSRASGDGGFQNEGRSELEATLTSVHPYLRYAASERLSLWGILGMGQGEMTLEESDQKHETDIDMRMGAFGVRGALTKMGGFDLAVKSDVMLTQMDSDAKDGLEAISAESSRLRLMLEASRKVAMEGGGTLRPSVEAGLRHDGGDVDEGLGVEVGGRLRFTSPSMGLTVELNARGLVTHEEKDVADWGVGGMIRIAPGKKGRGLALTVRPEVGETASGAARLWGIKDASRLAKEEIEDLDPRVRAEVGYGLDAWGGLLTPYAGLSVSDSGNGTYRLGGRFRMGERLSMSLEGDVRERMNADPVHGVALRGTMRW